MATLEQQIEKMKKLNIREQLENAFIDTQDDLTRAQRDQMLHGLDKFGDKIGKYKNKAYAAKKFAMNQKAGLGYKDLKLEGDFHREIIVDVRTNWIYFSSADEKLGDILAREGENIFGLSPKYAECYSQQWLETAANKRIQNVLR